MCFDRGTWWTRIVFVGEHHGDSHSSDVALGLGVTGHVCKPLFRVRSVRVGGFRAYGGDGGGAVWAWLFNYPFVCTHLPINVPKNAATQ